MMQAMMQQGMPPWAMMQGTMGGMMPQGGAPAGDNPYAAAGHYYPGYAAAYGGAGAQQYVDPYGRPYQMPGYGSAPAGYAQAPAYVAPAPAPAAADASRVEEARQQAMKQLEERRQQAEEVKKKLAAEHSATAAIRIAISNLQMGQSDNLEPLRKILDTVVSKEMANTGSQEKPIKNEVDKAVKESKEREDMMKELRGLVKISEDHLKMTAELIRKAMTLQDEKDREDHLKQLEKARLDADTMADAQRYFTDDRAKEMDTLISATKGPAAVELRLTVAKLSKQTTELKQMLGCSYQVFYIF
ncbi:unnamed protein product [Polarella glacialis]|uniref:Uncharacterized protein n=1 Tax=Polarella glacialis TaxID=89957 RepID=A0A813LCU1_POLGL|nr:unnamed protein product [Polarella glacialis]